MLGHTEASLQPQESFSGSSRAVADNSVGSRAVKGRVPLSVAHLSAPPCGSVWTTFFSG